MCCRHPQVPQVACIASRCSRSLQCCRRWGVERAAKGAGRIPLTVLFFSSFFYFYFFSLTRRLAPCWHRTRAQRWGVARYSACGAGRGVSVFWCVHQTRASQPVDGFVGAGLAAGPRTPKSKPFRFKTRRVCGGGAGRLRLPPLPRDSGNGQPPAPPARALRFPCEGEGPARRGTPGTP